VSAARKAPRNTQRPPDPCLPAGLNPPGAAPTAVAMPIKLAETAAQFNEFDEGGLAQSGVDLSDRRSAGATA
jgi:hypothetical protein